MVNADIKNSIIIGLIFITTIFTSYYWLQPVEETHKLLSNEYSLVVYDDSQSENFKSGGAGVFLISLDKKKKSEGFFTFRGDHSLLMDFFVGEGHESEGMKFTVTHNEREVFKSLSYENNSSHFSLSVNSGDEIRVTAENDSSATRIDGNIKVAVNEPYAEVISYIIPFIFSVLSIFLLGKGYIYLSINGYLIFTLIIFAEKSGFGGLNVGGVLAYTCLIFVMIFSFVYLHQELHFIKKIKAFHVLGNLIAAAIYVCPLLFVVYVLNFDAEVTKDTLRAVFQTNNSEMSEYISSYISPFYILFFVFIAALVGFLLYWQERKEKKVIDRSFLMFMNFFFLGLAVLESSNLRLFHFVYDTYTEYRSEVDVFFEARRKGSLEEFGAFKEGEGETFVFIIGESLNKNHMGLYGYFRETTPILSAENDKGEIIKFNTAYSNHSHTTPALSLSLTEGNQYSKSSSHSSLSIVEVLRKAEIETHWITNQTLGGPWGNNKVSIIASSVDNLVPFNTFAGQQIKSENYDEVLVDELKNILAKKSNKNRVIFIHLLGNHSGYALRYPNDRFSKFAGALSQGVFGLKASNKYINPYDNSVLYNDFVVGSILKEI
jgi:heptose-I-phosphate ethanolaminephosphotransferase